MTSGTDRKISIIVPVLNEEANIAQCLDVMQESRKAGHEVIVVDGGSTDKTRDLAGSLCDHLLGSEPGRSLQMNVGASFACGDILLFVHADTLLPGNFHEITSLNSESGIFWGRFDVKFNESRLVFVMIASLMNLRSRLTGIATGDQGIFISRLLFEKAGGYASIPLMEDIDLSCKLKKLARPHCLKDKVIVSNRRWKRYGIVRTILLMWYLRAGYFFGASPEKLAAIYYPAPKGR